MPKVFFFFSFQFSCYARIYIRTNSTFCFYKCYLLLLLHSSCILMVPSRTKNTKWRHKKYPFSLFIYFESSWWRLVNSLPWNIPIYYYSIAVFMSIVIKIVVYCRMLLFLKLIPPTMLMTFEEFALEDFIGILIGLTAEEKHRLRRT